MFFKWREINNAQKMKLHCFSCSTHGRICEQEVVLLIRYW